MEHCIAQLAEECCGFKTGKHPSPASESGPSGANMTGQLEEMMSHRSQLTSTDAAGRGHRDKQSQACEQVQTVKLKRLSSLHQFLITNLFRL